MFAMIKNQISAVSTKSHANEDGYCLVFEQLNNAKKPLSVSMQAKDEKAVNVKKIISVSPKSASQKKEDKVVNDEEAKKKPLSPKSPRSPKVSVEVIESKESEVVLKLYHEMDKYISGCAEKGPKGYKIEEFHKFFGDELKNAGIGIGWKLMKIGD